MLDALDNTPVSSLKQGRHECGGYALAYALSLVLSDEIDPDETTKRVVLKLPDLWGIGAFLSGTIPRRMVGEARRHRLKVSGRRVGWWFYSHFRRMRRLRRLSEVGPVIALIRGDTGESHYVVVLGCTAKTVEVYDSNCDEDDHLRTFTASEFDERWGKGGVLGFCNWWCMPLSRSSR